MNILEELYELVRESDCGCRPATGVAKHGGQLRKKRGCILPESGVWHGGLRGVIGVGTNRMNVYTVAKASQSLANYVKKNFAEKDWSVAVSYDLRNKSELFAKTTSGVLAANGIKVHIYTELMPTACLSFAVRELYCAAGIG